jgi:hypothetical protein
LIALCSAGVGCCANAIPASAIEAASTAAAARAAVADRVYFASAIAMLRSPVRERARA